jgi:hypothetical protein
MSSAERLLKGIIVFENNRAKSYFDALREMDEFYY